MASDRTVSVARIVGELRGRAKEHLAAADKCQHERRIAELKYGWHMSEWANLDNEAGYLERGVGQWADTLACDGEHSAPPCGSPECWRGRP